MAEVPVHPHQEEHDLEAMEAVEEHHQLGALEEGEGEGLQTMLGEEEEAEEADHQHREGEGQDEQMMEAEGVELERRSLEF